MIQDDKRKVLLLSAMLLQIFRYGNSTDHGSEREK
jgi:hypothetical protein